MSAILIAALPQLIPLFIALISTAGTMLLVAMRKRVAADTAQGKLLVIGSGLIGRAWDKLAPEVQAILADGKITAEERAHILDSVMQIVTDEDRQVLEDIGKALGVPFAGIVAGIAERFIDTWAKAHDPANQTVSALAFPVGGVRGGPAAVASDAG